MARATRSGGLGVLAAAGAKRWQPMRPTTARYSLPTTWSRWLPISLRWIPAASSRGGAACCMDTLRTRRRTCRRLVCWRSSPVEPMATTATLARAWRRWRLRWRWLLCACAGHCCVSRGGGGAAVRCHRTARATSSRRARRRRRRRSSRPRRGGRGSKRSGCRRGLPPAAGVVQCRNAAADALAREHPLPGDGAITFVEEGHKYTAYGSPVHQARRRASAGDYFEKSRPRGLHRRVV